MSVSQHDTTDKYHFYKTRELMSNTMHSPPDLTWAKENMRVSHDINLSDT